MGGIIRERNGKLSYARVSGLLIVCTYLICMSYIAGTTRVIPDMPPMLSMLTVGLYGLNKFGRKDDEPVKLAQ